MDTLQSLMELQARLSAEESRLSEEISRRLAEWEQTRARLEAQRAKVAAALQGLLAALEILPDLPGAIDEEASPSTLKDSLLELILAKDDPPVFTAPGLYQELEAVMPSMARHKASVSSAVKQIYEEGYLKLLHDARGRRAAVYARIDYEEPKPQDFEVASFGETDM